MKKVIHVNQHNVRSNLKHGTDLPVITVKTYKDNYYASTVEIKGPSTIKYTPEKPLSCGARVYVETTSDVIIDGQKVV